MKRDRLALASLENEPHPRPLPIKRGGEKDQYCRLVGRGVFCLSGLWLRRIAASFVLLAALAACQPQPSETPMPTVQPTTTPSQTCTLSPTDTPLPTATLTPQPSPTPTETMTPTATALPATSLPDDPESGADVPLSSESDSALEPAAAGDFAPPPGRQFATLEDFWNGRAEWVLEVYDTGLPRGESDTVYRGGSEFWSYLHASYESAGVVDQCGDPAPFPGCVTLWISRDGGQRFALESPVCLFPCASCPCETGRDQIGQQQYPRLSFQSDMAYMVYEHGAGTYLRTSTDGVNWSEAARVSGTGAWHTDQGGCTWAESIGEHPHIHSELEYDCLVGAPPGIYIEGSTLYVFVGLGRAPGHMGCFVGNRYSGVWGLQKCTNNPLFGAENGYGPVDVLGAAANPYFEFRTISSADVVRVGDHYYMTYEGTRGPIAITELENQFGLGLARSVGLAIDGPWERYPNNPIIMDLPGDIGVGHGDIVIVGSATYLYTTTSPSTRGRYALVYR